MCRGYHHGNKVAMPSMQICVAVQVCFSLWPQIHFPHFSASVNSRLHIWQGGAMVTSSSPKVTSPWLWPSVEAWMWLHVTQLFLFLVSALPWGLSTSYRGGNLLSLQTLLCLTALFSLLVKMLCHTPGNSPLYLVRLFSGSLCYDLNLTKHLPTMSTGPQAPFPFPRATVLIWVLGIPTGLALCDLCKGLSCLCSLSHHPQHWSPSCNLYDLSPQIKIQAHALKRGVRV